MSESIFTKIINHELPATVVYEDEQVIAFLDINPVHKGHTLIVPKIPFENIFDGDADTLAHMMKVGQIVGKAQKKALAADGVNLIMSNGAAANQEVFHAHLHVVPRFTGDGDYVAPCHETYGEGEANIVATQIIAALET